MLGFAKWYAGLCPWARSIWFDKYKEMVEDVVDMPTDTMLEKVDRIIAFNKGYNALVREITRLDKIAKREG